MPEDTRQIKPAAFKPNWTIRPGIALAEVLDDRKLTPDEAAAVTGLTAETLTAIVAGTVIIDQAIAEALHAGLGVSAQFWLNYQAGYLADLARGATDVSDSHAADFPWPPPEPARLVPDDGPMVTKTGRALTDADVSALADAAERGYDLPGGAAT